MSLTLGMTGMDPATETELKSAFEQANATLPRRWRLVPESDADYVVVDMDSMYGPMSWLRLHAAGKQVVGLTSARRSQTDFHLARPFTPAAVATVLQEMAAQEPAGAEPAGMAPSPVPQDELAGEHPQAGDEETRAPGPVPGNPGSEDVATLKPATVEPPAPPRERTLADWLVPGALSERVRFSAKGEPAIFIDPTAREYFGPGALKPLAGHFDGVVTESDFEPLAPGDWDAGVATLGQAQPLSRLQWFGGLLAGKGSLLPGFDPAGRYRLSKWPQTEREYPKHFRIATAMMKGPATLEEIASASGVAVAEVNDFVNASLATGYAEYVPDEPPEPAEPAKAGLFGRRKK